SRREASGAAGGAVDQIRVRHQPANGQGARPRNSADPARPRRRGDRIETRFAALHESAFGTKQACQFVSLYVRFRGDSYRIPVRHTGSVIYFTFDALKIMVSSQADCGRLPSLGW